MGERSNADTRKGRRRVFLCRIHCAEKFRFHGALSGLQLVQAAAQVLAITRFDALANGGPGGQGFELATEVADHVLVLWLGQQQLQRGDFHRVGLGSCGCGGVCGRGRFGGGCGYGGQGQRQVLKG